MKLNANWKLVILLWMMGFPFISFSQYADTELGHDGFMGTVKSAKITPYEVTIEDEQVVRGSFSSYQSRTYLKSGKLESVTDYAADGAVTRTQEFTFENGELLEMHDRMGDMTIKRETYSYDEAGNLLEKITYAGDGSVDQKKTQQYNKKNQLIETSTYSTSFGELMLTERKKMDYDDSGNNIKESFFSPEGESWGSTEMKYDKNGNMIEWLNLTETGATKIRQTYLYNEDNVLTTRSSFDENGNKINEANLDHLGQPLTLFRYDADGNILRKSGNRYDQFGNINMELKYESDGEESVYAEYKYTYDNNNNWIQQTAYQGGKAVYIIGREISYY